MKPGLQGRCFGTMALGWATGLAVICVSLDLSLAGLLAVLRVQSVRDWEHGASKAVKVLRFGDLVVDRAKQVVTIRGETVQMTTTEFKLLAALGERPGRIQSRDALLREAGEYTGDVDTHVRRLREKLGKAGDYIETVQGLGYRFNPKGEQRDR